MTQKLKGLFVLVPILIALMAAMIVAPHAFADSPHFLSSSAVIDTSGNLIVSFKEAGLGTILTTATLNASAQNTSVYACINGGGNHPKAANKETVSGPVSNSGTFPVRNGQTTGSITLSPVGPGDFTCPNGQDLVLASTSYSDVTITDTTESDSTSVSGTFSQVFFEV